MKNILLTLAAISGTAWSTFAQTSSTLPKDSLANAPDSGAHFSFGLEGGRTVPGQAKAILGASLKYELPFAAHTLFTASVGYSFLSFREETKKALNFYGINQTGASFLPVKVGVKHYLNNHFFVEGQVGAAILLSGGNAYNRYSSAYIYSGGFGYTFKKGLELGVRYEDWRKDVKISQAAVRVAYRFK
ncbi:hypothetical protein FPZ43_14220 [Mucilaginibacter pallidiroseus]|uniref:Outer membrane protein beta-barrel domain-containing protein n=1 Tax=Mucilaginibacter pallidiroseus TaxID=2599295 RepID=A0A563U4Q6_9SPHI|nr:acyloxyacyl hydrolase [Mucilaginibacter pallidiroseus]TWR26317.1 hypothetical protein FPZ43_14220 [Mucilaginibacter pallidiroseus]